MIWDYTGEPELHAFVLGNRSNVYSPKGWAAAVLAEPAAVDGDRVVAEVKGTVSTRRGLAP